MYSANDMRNDLYAVNDKLSSKFQSWDGTRIRNLDLCGQDAFIESYELMDEEDQSRVELNIKKYMEALETGLDNVKVNIIRISDEDTETKSDDKGKCCIEFSVNIPHASDFLPTYGRMRKTDYSILNLIKKVRPNSGYIEDRLDRLHGYGSDGSDPQLNHRVIIADRSLESSESIQCFDSIYVNDDGTFRTKGITKKPGKVNFILSRFTRDLVNNWILLKNDQQSTVTKPAASFYCPVYFGIQDVLYRSAVKLQNVRRDQKETYDNAEVDLLPGTLIEVKI